jgi:tetratricopeptide (TPR) repeat protein
MRAELAKEVQREARDYFGSYALGLVQLFDGHYVQAEASLLRARNARPEWPEPWLYLGLAAYSSGDQKRAEEDLRKAMALTLDDSRGNYQIRRAYYTLGRILTEQNRKADADDFVRRFREIQSQLLLDAQTTPGAMGSGMAQMSQSAAALAALAQLPTENSFLFPSAETEPTGIGSPFANALPYAQPSDAKKQETELRKVVSGAFNDLGTVQARGEQFAVAVSHFHEAEKWNAETPGLMRNIGMAAARLSDYRESVRALRPVVASNPADTVARSMLALALFSTDSYREAAEMFAPLGDAVLNRPELAYAWASSLVKINRFPEASAILHKLNERSVPPETLILIAQTWSQMGNYPQTVETCQKALSANPKLSKAHYIAGLALIHQDRPAEAAQEFRAELQLDPENAEAQFHLAFVLLQLSQNDEATQWLRTVLAHNPEHPEANYELGKELMSEGRSAQAIPYLEVAARLKPQFEPVHYQLQSAYRAAGRKEEADYEARVYRELKAKSRNITLPPPRQQSSETSSPDNP